MLSICSQSLHSKDVFLPKFVEIGRNDQTHMVAFSNSFYYIYSEMLNTFSWRHLINTDASWKDVHHKNWKFADRWM